MVDLIATPSHEQRLREIIAETPWFMAALQAMNQLQLPSACIGAGAVRNLVWDALHGYTVPSSLSDIDIAYFDAADLRPESEDKLQQQLQAMLPAAPWEVSNQARVHLWFEAHFGYAVPPLRSLEDAVASWPEYATSIGVSLAPDGAIAIIAPYGLEDLFNMVVRRNPVRVSVDGYASRVEQKRYHERWPRVTVIGMPD
ncbi:nucleotidyltransferase family protein [Janthinobacterium sp.]|jgi:uncharacterized protein|uniref:nucleotidyltransferase family protein n=1 Tax=Janthinobacterium sp. TaxID=1871054 RepID=UPI002629838B|nr:nucleotidyltransferase family protein [Janthinobacterium sp.]